jgi:hypothetical protein
VTAVLSPADWTARRAHHERRVDRLLGGHRERRRHGRAHPVEDFLFSYYSFRPAHLRRWHPGQGVALDGARPDDFGPFHTTDPAGRVVVDVAALLDRRGDSIAWVHGLLRATAGRPPHYGCFGMHEWAMVYRQGPDETRHPLPLRLGVEGTAALVDEVRVRCSHFDAYRFFTPAARPLNELRPTRDTQADHEQPGCLHANMDVYRWAYKLAPLAGSDLITDCFELAREIRMLDMRASPYDVAPLGLEPILMETTAGRAEYARHQRAFTTDAAVLRTRLTEACEAALTADVRATAPVRNRAR